MEHDSRRKRKAVFNWTAEVDLRLLAALRAQLGSDTWTSSSPAFDWQAIFRDGGPWPEEISAEALKTRWQNSFRGWPLTSKERHQGRRADRIEFAFIERLVRERPAASSQGPRPSKSSLKRKKAEPSEEEAEPGPAYEDDHESAELPDHLQDLGPQQVPDEFRLILEERQDLEAWQNALRQATLSGRSADAFVLRLGDGSFELDPSAPLLPEQPAAVEMLAAEFSSPAVRVLREAAGRWVCCREAGPLLECWDPAPELPRPRCEGLCGVERRLELRPCPPLASGLVALTAAALLSRIPAGEPLDLVSRWPGEAAARDWLSLQLLLRCRPALCMLQPEERPRYVHSSPFAALREAIPGLRPWLARLPFEDFRDAVAEHHHLRVALLREGITLAEFDWDPQADAERNFSLLGESAEVSFSLLGESAGRYVLLVNARLPAPGASQLAVRWGATAGVRLASPPGEEVPLQARHLAFSVGRARITLRWPCAAAAPALLDRSQALHVAAPPPSAPPEAKSPPLHDPPLALTADEEAKLVDCLRREGTLSIGPHEILLRALRDMLLRDGDPDDSMVNALFCLEGSPARPGHAVLGPDFFAQAREHGPKAVLGHLHHAAASAAIFHVPIFCSGRWAYAVASGGSILLFAPADVDAGELGRTLSACFAAAFADRGGWAVARAISMPQPGSAALQAAVAHALAVRCEDLPSLAAIDLSSVGPPAARRWLASRLVAAGKFVRGAADADVSDYRNDVVLPQALSIASDSPAAAGTHSNADIEMKESAPEGGGAPGLPARPSDLGTAVVAPSPVLPTLAAPSARDSAIELAKMPPAASAEPARPVAEELPQRGTNLACLEKADLDRLQPKEWLNDAVINAYFELLGNSRPEARSFFFNTFFYDKLALGPSGYSYAAVQRWTKGVDIFSHRLLLFPVHLPGHWVLATVNFSHKHVGYLDSLGGCDDGVLAHIKRYLENEWRARKRKVCDFSSWTEGARKVPQQDNGTDCGVFVCKFAECLTRGDGSNEPEFDFAAKDVPRVREETLGELKSAWERTRARAQPPKPHDGGASEEVVQPASSASRSAATPPPPPPDPYKDGTPEELKKTCGIDFLVEPGADARRGDFVLAALKDGRTARILTVRLQSASWSIEPSDLVASVSDGSGQLAVDSLELPCDAEAELVVATVLPEHPKFRLTLPPTPRAPPAPSPKLKPPPKKRRTAASTGVVNSDSNCYLGVVLMALFADREFRRQALELRAEALAPPPPDAPPEVRDSAVVLPALVDIFRTLHAREGPASPQALLSRILKSKEFAGKKFQDAPDVYHWLVERLGPLGERFSFSAVQLNGDCPGCKRSAPGSVGYSRWHHVVTALPVKRSARTTVALADLFPESPASVDAKCAACETALPQRWQFETAPFTLVMEIARLVLQGPVPPAETWRVKVPDVLDVKYGARSRRYALAAAVYYTNRHGVDHYFAVARGDDDAWWRYDDAQPAKPCKGFQKAVNASQTGKVLLRMLVWCAVHEREAQETIRNESFVLEAVEV